VARTEIVEDEPYLNEIILSEDLFILPLRMDGKPRALIIVISSATEK
jgi:hypothetical protein